MTEFINLSASIGVLTVLSLGIITILGFLIFKNENNKILTFIKTNWVVIYFIILASGVLTSLYYSEIAKFTPCKLCWIQRIFYVSQLFIIVTIWLNKKITKEMKDVFLNAVLPVLSISALVFALLHNYEYYFGGSSSVLCDASSNCNAIYMDTFGFMSIPFMSLGMLVGLFAIIIVRKFYKFK